MRLVYFLSFLALLSCQPSRDSWITLKGGERVRLPHAETLSAVLASEPPSIDWLTSTDTSSSWIEEHIMDGLVGFDLNQEPLTPEPALATSWEVSEDGLEWTFYLRRDVLWSDGKPFVSRHVYDAFWRVLAPETAALSVQNLFVIDKAMEFNRGEIKDFSEVGVETLDSHTVKFRLRRPTAFFPMLLAHHSTFPIRLDVIETHKERWTEPENIVTLGPYHPIYWHHDSRMVLQRNEAYWKGPPAIKYLTFYMIDRSSTQLRMFERGKIDFIRDIPSSEIQRLSQRPEYHSTPALRIYYYGFKVEKKPFNKTEMRQAIAHAIDRSEVVQLLGAGQRALTGWVPHGLAGHSDEIGLAFDLKKARALMKAAGYPDGKKLPRITLGFNSDEQHKMIAENIQAQLRRNLNIKIELRSEEWKTYLSSLKSKSSYSLFRLGWVADFPDPHNFMSTMKSTSPNNRTGWKSYQYDYWVNRALEQDDEELRIKDYINAQKYLVERAVPVIPLFTAVNQVLVSQRVKGFKINRLHNYHFHRMELK